MSKKLRKSSHSLRQHFKKGISNFCEFSLEAALLHACDADYPLIVIADCCADMDAALHEALVKRFFPQRAAVVTASEFVEPLQST